MAARGRHYEMEVRILGFWCDRGVIILWFGGLIETEWEMKKDLGIQLGKDMFYLLNMVEEKKWNSSLVMQARSVTKHTVFAHGNDVIDDINN